MFESKKKCVIKDIILFQKAVSVGAILIICEDVPSNYFEKKKPNKN